MLTDALLMKNMLYVLIVDQGPLVRIFTLFISLIKE
jgi:hypothetical protein